MNRLKIENGGLYFYKIKVDEIRQDKVIFGKKDGYHDWCILYKDLTKQEKLTLLEYLKLKVESG